MLRHKVFTCGLLAWILSPALAFAQGGASGSIVGYIYDQTGSPLKGVKVQATSPTQIGGTKSVYTNDEGEFRFMALFPGDFEVRAHAPKLKTYVQKDIKVGISSAAELNIVMEVESGGVEEVKIVEKAPVVSTTTPNVKEVYDLDFVEGLPMNSRDQVHTQMINEVAGAMNGRMRGGTSGQTLFYQDGFELNAGNRDGIYPVLKSSAAFEINTAGYGADAPTASGGSINLVTKTGSNKYEFEFNAAVESSRLQFFTDERDKDLTNYYYYFAPLISGPIIKDRLWFFATDEIQTQYKERDRDADGVLPNTTYTKFLHKGTVKLTWQINSRNKLSSLTNLEYPIWEHNMRTTLGIEPEAQQDRYARRSFTGLIYEALLTDSVVFRSQVGAMQSPQHIYPTSCRTDPNCDYVPAVTNSVKGGKLELVNNPIHQRLDMVNVQFSNTLQWFANSHALGEHSIKLQDRFFTETNTERTSHPGDQLTELTGSAPTTQTQYYSNDPRYEEGRRGWFINTATIYRHTATISDSWRPTRYLTITPALSHIWATGENNRGDRLIDTYSLAPGISAAWDATHDGRTVLRGSFSQYVDVDILTLARHTVGDETKLKCKWNDSTSAFDKDCVYSGGLSRNTFGSPCGPSGLNPDGSSCITDLTIPRTWEYTAGAEREIVQGLAMSLDFVYRKFANQYEINETNRIWNASGTAVDGYRNGRNETILDMGTPEKAQRQYAGATVGLNKREGRFKVHSSYTLSQLRGNVFQGTNNQWGDIPARDVYLEDAYLSDDHRHEIKTTLSYQMATWLTLGVRHSWLSGTPYNRFIKNDETNSFDSYRAAAGVNPGANINDPGDDRPLRYPDLQNLNTQVRLNLMPLIGQRLDFYVDVLNVLANRTALTVGQNDGQDFGTERTWQAPFRIRLGMNYRY